MRGPRCFFFCLEQDFSRLYLVNIGLLLSQILALRFSSDPIAAGVYIRVISGKLCSLFASGSADYYRKRHFSLRKIPSKSPL